MKKYLNELLDEQYTKLKLSQTKKDFDNINKNISQLLFYINKNTDYISLYKSICLSNIPVDENFYKFIYEIINLYADIPLLDTESSIKYPILKNIKINSYNELYEFWNRVYKLELPSSNKKILNSTNTILFEKNHLKRFFMFPGKCVVYKDFSGNNNKMLIDRFYNVRDFVIPCSVGTQFLIDDNESIALQQICSAYMRAKAVQQLKQSKYYIEAKKLELIHIDLLAYDARYLKKNIGVLKTNPIVKGHILNFIYTIIGYYLAYYNNINLEDILNNYDGTFFENDQSKIAAHTKLLVKKLKDSEIKK